MGKRESVNRTIAKETAMQVMIKYIKKYILMIGVTAAAIALLMILSPHTRSWKTLLSVLAQGIAPAILGWGVLFNIKAGNWDFGVGAEVLIAAIIGGNIAKTGNLGVVGMILCCMITGALAGTLSGIIYRVMKIPTIIITIAMMLIYESVCGVIFDGKGVSLDMEYVILSKAPWNVLLFLVGFLIAYFLFFKLKIGYRIKAVGSNIKVAEENGNNVVMTKAAALVIAGLFAGLYAAVNLGSSGVTRTVSSMGTMGTCFNAMMCVFIGMSIAAGGNIFVAIYFGAVIMQLIQMALMVFMIPTQYSQIIVALFVIIFMLLSTNADEMRERIRRHKTRKSLSNDNV